MDSTWREVSAATGWLRPNTRNTQHDGVVVAPAGTERQQPSGTLSREQQPLPPTYHNKHCGCGFDQSETVWMAEVSGLAPMQIDPPPRSPKIDPPVATTIASGPELLQQAGPLSDCQDEQAQSTKGVHCPPHSSGSSGTDEKTRRLGSPWVEKYRCGRLSPHWLWPPSDFESQANLVCVCGPTVTFRPRSLDGVAHQAEVVAALKRTLETGNVRPCCSRLWLSSHHTHSVHTSSCRIWSCMVRRAPAKPAPYWLWLVTCLGLSWRGSSG